MADSKRKPATLTVGTSLLVYELAGGDCVAQSVAFQDRVAYGSDQSAVEQQREFLERFLIAARADEVARCQLPAELELLQVEVDLLRLDLPARMRRPLTVSVPCIVAPAGRDRWVMVPSVGHTFHVAAVEDLEAVVRAEVARIANAAGAERFDLRSLLPAEDVWLERVAIELLVGDEGLAGRAASVRKKRLEEHRRKRALELLDEVAVELNGGGAPLVGRERELAELAAALSGPGRGSVLVVGEEACGKSALIRSWRAAHPEQLVYSTSVAQLVAGTSGFGEWQERVQSVLAAAHLVHATLYFDNLAELFGEHPEQGGVDVAGALRSWVIEERVRVLGEIAPRALESARRHQVALLGAMAQVQLLPLDEARTREAVTARIAYWASTQPDRAQVDPAVSEPLVDLAARYMPYRAFPGKAIQFLEELRATRAQVRDADGRPQPIRLTDCYDAFSLTSGVPGFLLREDEPLDVEQLVAVFRRRMIGQQQAVRRVAETVCMVKARLQPAGKPLATFLFVGPTGVGKTELARTLAAHLFGSADRMTRFDMSEYTDPLAAERLIRGTTRDEGLLTGKVREQPFCVLLLDEIEKADRAVHDLLLQVAGEGRLTDARGRTTNFYNAIIIMTSNLGATHRRRAIGIGAADRADDDRYERAARDAFRPEMINRIDRIVAFSSLAEDEVAQVAALAVARIQERRGLQENGIGLTVTDAALAELSRGGYSEAYGVRALRRYLDAALVTPLAHELARLGAAARGAAAWVGLAGEEAPDELGPRQRISRTPVGALVIELYRRATTGARSVRGVTGAAALRREADRLMRLDEAVEVADEVAALRAQLTQVAAPSKRARNKRRKEAVGAQIAALQTRYSLLSRLLDRARTARGDLHAAEELGITAVLDGEDAADLASEVGELYRSFRERFFYLLTARNPVRDQAFVRVSRIEGAAPTAEWLLPMLRWARRLGWRIDVHLPRDSQRAPGWPAERPFGPARELGWLAGRLESDPAAVNDLLLAVRGDGAGLLLPPEAGLHRFTGWSNRPQGDYLKVDFLASRATLTDAEWSSPTLAEPRPRSVPARPAPVRARVSGEAEVVVCGGATVGIADGYFARLPEIALEQLLWARARGGIAALYRGRLDAAGGADEDAADA